MIKRPGEASVQYGDVRGEAAADMADDITNLDQAARALGFRFNGTVVGISVFASPVFEDKVHVTVQVFEGGSWDAIKAAVDASGGRLKVGELDAEVPLAAFMKCFKRLKVALFARDSGVREIEITPTR